MTNAETNVTKGTSSKAVLYTYFAIFFLSGFSGLIYQSVWSRYLKLFLGSASYAQMLVIIIFMGGMAIGSALAARYSFKLKNLILWYGICEAVIGLFGLAFHGIFTTTIAVFFDSIAPAVGSGFFINTIKFSLASTIILPQSILLGATFPLITAGLLRKYPDHSGSKISTLYFLNSFGAAIGVMFSAFVLVPKVGLPGTALTSGIINILLAMVVYALSKGDSFTVEKQQLMTKRNQLTYLFLFISAITGLASFMYEIAWIRMLSMVFGASTDAFEIMLSTFVFGLAIGALLIRNWVDKFKDPIKVLAIIQLIMGIFAVLTIPLYNQVFDYMVFIKQALLPTDSGYILYNITTILLSSLVMLPTTICAGTTLPLITHILIKQYRAESAVGAVYSFNTIGAILGVLLTVQFVMPVFGLKYVILLGGALDILLGLILLVRFVGIKKLGTLVAVPLASIAALVVVNMVGLDRLKMASGVFRHGSLYTSEGGVESLFHEDGKVSTVSILSTIQNGNKVRSLINNGKPDAALFLDSKNDPDADESTMYLLGIIPQLFTVENPLVANIGFGSGITADAVLYNPKIKGLDTIEIEQKVVDASHFFYPAVRKVHTDPRSKIIIDDAKTVFSTNGKKYDLIISEPPNPWVSGVASLFTVEWYDYIKKYMTQDGIFAQWLHGYELNNDLFALVYQSLRKEFDYIKVFTVSGFSDFVIIASKKPLDLKQKQFLNNTKVKSTLSRLKINSYEDLYDIRYIANQEMLDLLLLDSKSVNSDYFPLLDHESPRARYKNERVDVLYRIKADRLLQEVFHGSYYLNESLISKLTKDVNDLKLSYQIKTANAIYGYALGSALPESFPEEALRLRQELLFCKSTDATTLGVESLERLHNSMVRNLVEDFYILTKATIKAYTEELLNNCSARMSKTNLFKLKIIHAYATGDNNSLHDLTSSFFNIDYKKISNDDTILVSKFLLLSLHRLNIEIPKDFEALIKKVNNQELTAMYHFIKYKQVVR